MGHDPGLQFLPRQFDSGVARTARLPDIVRIFLTKKYRTARGRVLARVLVMQRPQRYVYVLRSAENPERYYTGVTSDVRQRLEAHNSGACRHSRNARPWRIDVVIAFSDEARALAFEKYLKSGSGSAFAHRHFRQTIARARS